MLMCDGGVAISSEQTAQVDNTHFYPLLDVYVHVLPVCDQQRCYLNTLSTELGPQGDYTI